MGMIRMVLTVLAFRQRYLHLQVNKLKLFVRSSCVHVRWLACMVCGHLANGICDDWSEFIIFRGGGTEKSDGDDQIHGTKT